MLCLPLGSRCHRRTQCTGCTSPVLVDCIHHTECLRREGGREGGGEGEREGGREGGELKVRGRC